MKTLRTRFMAIFGVLSLATIVGSVGCAAIVGADDYAVGAAGEGTAGSSSGQSGTNVGVAGNDGVAGSETGMAGTVDNRRDASVPEDAPVIVKPESSVMPPKTDAAKPDVAVPDTGTGGKPVASGETLCTNTCAGAGLTCQHTALGTSGLCTYLCNDPSECDATHDCIGSSNAASMFNYACVKKCPNSVCPTGLSCVPISNVGSVCMPTDWLPKDLGLGDDCIADTQCKSGVCLNKPNGWCSEPCQSFDLCSGDYTSGKNYYDEYNWCVNVLGGYRCAAGCDLGADCSPYPGTTCRTVVDIDGYSDDVCIP